jgi:uncharacterized RmlC-like cupin family protein
MINVVTSTCSKSGAKKISMNLVIISAGVPHQPHNLSDTKAAHAIVSRNDPNEQENVVLYDPQY